MIQVCLKYESEVCPKYENFEKLHHCDSSMFEVWVWSMSKVWKLWKNESKWFKYVSSMKTCIKYQTK